MLDLLVHRNILVFLIIGNFILSASSLANEPFGVVFGDSIAQGGPDHFSRLNSKGHGVFDPNYPDLPGQFSYELRGCRGLSRWINHGFGGQTSTQLWNRWRRDALGSEVRVGDVTTHPQITRTLEGLPSWILISAGTNDLAKSQISQLEVAELVVKNNIINFLESASQQGVSTVLMNLPPQKDPNRLESVKKINLWIHEMINARFQNVYEVDFYSFVIQNHDQAPNPIFNDFIHPTSQGYILLSHLIKSQIGCGPISGI